MKNGKAGWECQHVLVIGIQVDAWSVNVEQGHVETQASCSLASMRLWNHLTISSNALAMPTPDPHPGVQVDQQALVLLDETQEV